MQYVSGTNWKLRKSLSNIEEASNQQKFAANYYSKKSARILNTAVKTGCWNHSSTRYTVYKGNIKNLSNMLLKHHYYFRDILRKIARILIPNTRASYQEQPFLLWRFAPRSGMIGENSPRNNLLSCWRLQYDETAEQVREGSISQKSIISSSIVTQLTDHNT